MLLHLVRCVVLAPVRAMLQAQPALPESFIDRYDLCKTGAGSLEKNGDNMRRVAATILVFSSFYTEVLLYLQYKITSNK